MHRSVLGMRDGRGAKTAGRVLLGLVLCGPGPEALQLDTNKGRLPCHKGSYCRL